MGRSSRQLGRDPVQRVRSFRNTAVGVASEPVREHLSQCWLGRGFSAAALGLTGGRALD